MKDNSYHYSLKMTKAYPADVRIFISRIIPLTIEFYNFPSHFNKELELNRFDWGNMYVRKEEHIIGKKDSPKVKIVRNVFGEMQFTDEWENSSLELLDFRPPFINDDLSLKIECSESFLETDKGNHQCSINLTTNSLILRDKIIKTIDGILEKFINAQLEIIEN